MEMRLLDLEALEDRFRLGYLEDRDHLARLEDLLLQLRLVGRQDLEGPEIPQGPGGPCGPGQHSASVSLMTYNTGPLPGYAIT